MSLVCAVLAPRVALGLGSCGAAGLAAGTTKLVPWNGTEYYTRIPTCYSKDRPIPAVIHLHGDGGGGDIILSNAYWGGIYEKECFLLFAPNAVPGGKGSWSPNEKPGKCGLPTEWQCRELLLDKFIEEEVMAKYNVDLDRVYLAGWSGGAVFLSFYPLIKGRQEQFAGVGYNFCASIGWWDKSYGVNRPECKIPGYYVALQDWLRAECKQHADKLKGLGHEVVYKEVDQMHGNITPEMVAPEWAFFKAHVLCGAARPEGCVGGPAPDAGMGGDGGAADGGGEGGSGATDGTHHGEATGGCNCTAAGEPLVRAPFPELLSPPMVLLVRRRRRSAPA